YSVRHSRHCNPRTYPVNGPPNFRCRLERSPQVNPYGDNYSNRDNRRIRIGIDDPIDALGCAGWTLRTAGPGVARELAYRAELRDEHRIARPDQLGIQVRPFTVDENDHAPVAPDGLAI